MAAFTMRRQRLCSPGACSGSCSRLQLLLRLLLLLLRLLPAPFLSPGWAIPERYAGDPEGCDPFIMNCSILYALQPQTFSSEEAKVAFAINHLMGRACLWGTAEWEQRTPACVSLLWTSRSLHLPMPSKRDRLTSRGGSNDSGADVSLIDEELALQLGITRIPLSKAISASA
ncbi:hypothetical protein L3Q82_013736 [Scortum barcoo]|uniref:Uncharacterized protein n=1 Tax=Scortum barcoo TaxID=214431 RepID=A0ACB8W1L0_9TELE|nr:hypothetical protein L3Q82_013736 [Scortum barcoo]